MDTSTTEQAVDFGVEQFKANATLYAENKRLVDAVARCDSLDDAIATVTKVWDAFEGQIEHGSGYTPGKELGFGSENGQQIAETILGRRATDAAIKKAVSNLGKS